MNKEELKQFCESMLKLCADEAKKYREMGEVDLAAFNQGGAFAYERVLRQLKKLK